MSRRELCTIPFMAGLLASPASVVRAVAALSILSSGTLSAQETATRSGSAPQAIDILVDTAPQEDTVENCSPQQEDAAIISGEIIVCRRITGNENRLYSTAEAERRYARETMNQGIIAAPDVAGAGIFRGPASVSGLCVIPPCPPPPAYIIDFAELPEAPPGSDADRIGRGLPAGGTRRVAPIDAASGPIELRLPKPADGGKPDAVSPPESASPAEPPSG